MILEIHKKGRGFKGLLRYIFGKGKANPRVLGGSMSGVTIGDLCREAARFRRKRPNLKKAIFHASLRQAPGENLSEEDLTNIAMEVMGDLGFARAPFVVCRHDDHIHIAAIRIDADGITVSDSNDFAKGAKSLQRLEKEYGLAPIAMTPIEATKKGKRGAPNWQVHGQKRTGQRPGQTKLQDIIDAVLRRGMVSLEMFVKQLGAKNVEVKIYHRKGVLSGLSFALDGTKYKASDLGANYKIDGLRMRGLDDNLTSAQVAKTESVRLQELESRRKRKDRHDPDWRQRSTAQRQYYILYRYNIDEEVIGDFHLWENANGRFLINNHRDYHIWDKGHMLVLRKAGNADLAIAVRLMLEIAEDKGWDLQYSADHATGCEDFLDEVRMQVQERLAAKEVDQPPVHKPSPSRKRHGPRP